jgi:hypothetical protein
VDAHDVVGHGVVTWRAAEDFLAEFELVNLLDVVVEDAAAEILKELGQTDGAVQLTAGEDAIRQLPELLYIASRR